MTLTDAQKSIIGEWVSEGQSLGEIQTRIQSEFDVSMTYMDVRFLVDDLNLLLKDKPKEETVEDVTKAPIPGEPQEGVTVEVDKLVRPGAIVSGSVTFTDGVTAQWSLDQMGRLGLTGTPEDYQPNPEDVQEFQMALQEELQKKGMG